MAKRVNSLTLLAGTPVPVPELGTELHQPKLVDIAKLTEDGFYQAISVFTTKKEAYLEQLQKRVEQDPNMPQEVYDRAVSEVAFMTDYRLVLSLLEGSEETKAHLTSFLFICLPTLTKCFIDDMAIILSFQNGVNEEGKPKSRQVIFSEEHFSAMVEIIEDLFASEEMNKKAFNPASDKAAEIAAKLERRRAIVAREKGLDKKKTSSIATAISILSSIDKTPLTDILNYTLPQLSFQLERSKELVSYETQITLGAFSGLKDVELADWAKSI